MDIKKILPMITGQRLHLALTYLEDIEQSIQRGPEATPIVEMLKIDPECDPNDARPHIHWADAYKAMVQWSRLNVFIKTLYDKEAHFVIVGIVDILIATPWRPPPYGAFRNYDLKLIDGLTKFLQAVAVGEISLEPS